MEVTTLETNWYRLAPLVSYDDYDNHGFLLDIRQGILVELDEHDTVLLSAVLRCSTYDQFKTLHCTLSETDVFALLARLQEQKLLERQTATPLIPPSHSDARLRCNHRGKQGERLSGKCITLRQRLMGAGHIICVLNALRQTNEGLYRAYQYIHTVRKGWRERDTNQEFSTDVSFQFVRHEYWYYRLITGLIERKVARLLGQHAGDEGLCMIRSFALCAYLLSFGVPSQMIIARPKYGSCNGFKLHVWVEIRKKPVNEQPNVAAAYRIMARFPVEQ